MQASSPPSRRGGTPRPTIAASRPRRTGKRSGRSSTEEFAKPASRASTPSLSICLARRRYAVARGRRRYGEFLACTRFPACKHTRPVPLGVKCPKCGVGDLAERRTRKGRNFFGCLRYPECDYSTWNRPVAVACPSCGFVGMEEKQTKTKGVSRKCLRSEEHTS